MTSAAAHPSAPATSATREHMLRAEGVSMIFVRGDQTIAYGRVMEVMGTLNQAGFSRVALVTQQPGTAAAPARSPAPRR